MSNISLDSSKLESLIAKLETDNKKIYDIVTNINTSLRQLDGSLWSSREKTKCDTTVESFLKENDSNLLDYLNECTDLLRAAKQSYQSQDNALKEVVENS